MSSQSPYQIKLKSKLPLKYADHLATLTEREQANRRIDSGAYKITRVTVGVVGGVATFFAGCFIFSLFVANNSAIRLNAGISFTILGISIALPLFVTKLMRQSNFNNALFEIVSASLKATHEHEQQSEERSVTQAEIKCVSICKEQPTNLATLDNLLGKAEKLLAQSDQLFKERAFTPFWDTVEETVDSLKKFNDWVGLINSSAKQYYGLLEGREHNFPPFPVKSADVPSPDSVVQKLTQVIAVAHRDFQFASIYEQRKTTSAVVAGFRSMQEAITRLGEDIVSSISSLHDSLDSGLRAIHSQLESMEESQQKSAAELRETLESHGKADQTRDKRDEKHQEFVKGALDNIQRDRKPPA